MAIAPLQLPGPLQTKPIDWSGLDKIGDAISDFQRRKQLGDLITQATGPDGKVDPNMVVSALARAGRPADALPYAHLAQTSQFHADTVAQQRAQLEESSRHDRATEGQAGALLTETRRMHDLDLAKPFKAGEDYFGQPTYLARDKSGNYVPVVIPQQSGQPPGPAPMPSAAPSPFPNPPAPGAPQTINPGQPVPLPQPGQPTTAPVQSTSASGDPEEARKATFLASRPEAARGVIKGIANYDQDERTALSRMPAGARARIISDTAEYDPSYSQANYPSIVDARKKFGAGPLGVAIRSFDVSIGHLEQLKGYAEALANNDTQVINRIRNAWRTETGSDLPTNFNALKPIVSAEVTKAIVGSNNAMSDRAEFQQPLKDASSPAQFAGAIGTYQKAMAEQLAGTEKQYADTTKWKNFRERLRPETLKVLDAHSRGAGPTQGSTAPLPPGFVLVK